MTSTNTKMKGLLFIRQKQEKCFSGDLFRSKATPRLQLRVRSFLRRTSQATPPIKIGRVIQATTANTATARQLFFSILPKNKQTSKQTWKKTRLNKGTEKKTRANGIKTREPNSFGAKLPTLRSSTGHCSIPSEIQWLLFSPAGGVLSGQTRIRHGHD